MHQDDEITSRALDLFDQYADMPRERLNGALEALKRQDAAVHASLVTLLDADAMPYTFASPLRWIATRSESDARGDTTAIWRSGTRLGAWCVDSVIGIGGMGIVYAAHRDDGLYEQDIALKTIRSELISPALLAAFAHERSNLARLEHASIASLVDAGISEDGQPWLAMQRVTGDPMDRWCDGHLLDLRTRILRLIDACDAVRHAHGHGILHQDIKPSNLLVTQDGQVKLLDFGLSSLLSSAAEGGSARIGVSCGYAAPEVFRGGPPSIAIDVYALGVVLYRLICGEGPMKPSSLPASEDAAPESPSVLASRSDPQVARSRGARNAQALARMLRGDLDAIALRAVAIDPQERYLAVAELQRDLSAWIQRQPVSARGGRWRYRAITHARRNAISIAAFVMCAVAVMLSAGAMFVQHRSAQASAEATAMLSRVFEESLGVATLSSLGNAPLSSQTLLSDTEQRIRERVGHDQPKPLALGLIALARTQLISGDYRQAARLADEAKRIGAGDPLLTARADAARAQLLSLQSRHADAERIVRAAMQTVPERRGIEDDLVRLDLQMQLARARWGRGDTRGAIVVLDAAVLSAQGLGAEGLPAQAELLGQRGYAETKLFEFVEAERDLRRALKLIGDRSPMTANAVRRNLVDLLVLTSHRKPALRQASDLLESNRTLFGEAHPETGRAWIAVGKSWFYNKNSVRAASALDRAAQIFDRTLGQQHPDFVDALVIRGAIAYHSGDYALALDIAREAADVLERAYGPNHEETLKRKTDLASLLLQNGRMLGGERQRALFLEARVLLYEVLGTGERQGLPIAYARDEYAETLLYDHQVDEAERQAQRGITEMSELFGPDSDYPEAAWTSMLKIRIAQGRYDEASAIHSRLLCLAPSIEEAPHEHFVMGVSKLDIEIARGDAVRISAAYRDVERVARKYGYMDELNAKRTSGMSSPARRG
ncbi:MAG: protein kinase [Lysobacter sp.]|nr:protein kinase [Lysobacter sp.]